MAKDPESADQRPRSLAGDVSDAWELRNTGQPMPPRLWAAYMADVTSMHTYDVVRNVSGAIVGFGADIVWERVVTGSRVGPKGQVPTYSLRRSGTSLNYQRPPDIARRIAATWGTARPVLSRDELAEAILLLDDIGRRADALEAAGLLARNAPPELRDTALLDARRRIEALTEQTTLFEAPRGAVMTEPRHMFEAQLQQIQSDRGELVDQFMGAGGAPALEILEGGVE